MKTMNIEIQIPSIDQAEVVDAVARELLRVWSVGGDGLGYERESRLGQALRVALLERIDQVAKDLVRSRLDEMVRRKVDSVIDVVLADACYGYAKHGKRMDLRAFIESLLVEQQRDGAGKETGTTLLEERIRKLVPDLIDDDLNGILKEARATLRDKLDRSVMEKLGETIRSALGLPSS
jgi:hypothetical protein